MRQISITVACIALVAAVRAFALDAGVGRAPISPSFPVRLSGYGSRTNSSQGVAQPIWAKAIALGNGAEACLIVTVDNCGLSAAITDEISNRLKQRFNILRERIAFCFTHTHSAPMVTGVLPNLFASDLKPDEQSAIDRYTRELEDHLTEAAASALNDRRPARVSWAEGMAKFAINRRVARGGAVQFGSNGAGPVDHSLPVLIVSDSEGKIRAVWASYACHGTTLGGDFNEVHGDWPGCAQEEIERAFPGSTALVSLGCAGDANPNPRGKLTNAIAHGQEVAAEVRRLVGSSTAELTALPLCRLERFNLDFDPLPSNEEWQRRAKQKGIVGYHARKNLERLAGGEPLPAHLPYTVQTWSFGTNLGMVFLAGEVVVDYELRLKREFSTRPLWVNGYANDDPCYIPSARILREGGYEAEDSLWYYDRPARLSTNNEERIIQAVHRLLPGKELGRAKEPVPASLAPAEALRSIHVAPQFRVDLVAAEPLVFDPVAIDWGADGKLWVAEMRDYPTGIDGHWKPGGHVRFLQDTNGDAHYDVSTDFLDGLPFPTGVFAWGKGVLICAAPDIIYAEDTNGDGRADVVRKVFSGFQTNNYQARVNSLSLGLDNWIYGANGLLGGVISGMNGTNNVDIRGRDFRISPGLDHFEPASGLTQQGRVRDDFGNWFGCDNSHLAWHFPLPDEYVRHNPFVSGPNPAVHMARQRYWNRVFPASETLERFNDPQSANRVTSGCGLEVYRDEQLGAGFYGNTFTCEPVHNLIHREVLSSDGVTFTSHRAADESTREFFSSTDNWCRPVQVRTGPDGALWVVDMYRAVIEHPRWIPSNRLATLDVRAGADRGRIYRVLRKDASPRPIRRYDQLGTTELAAALDSPNGTERDIIHRDLLNRGDKTAAPELMRLAADSMRSAVRVQALFVLDGLRSLTPDFLRARIGDPDDHVRAAVIRLSEAHLKSDKRFVEAVAAAARDDSILVRYQAALSAGSAEARPAGTILSVILPETATNAWMRAAVLASATNCAFDLLQSSLAIEPLAEPMLKTFLGAAKASEVQAAFKEMAPSKSQPITPLRLRCAALLAEDAVKRGQRLSENLDLMACARIALMEGYNSRMREAALRFITAAGTDGDFLLIAPLLKANALQSNAIAALLRSGRSSVPSLVIRPWSDFSPAQREMVLEGLASRAAWQEPLLAAVEEGTIPPNEISISLRNRLRGIDDLKLRHRAELLWPDRRPEKKATFAAYEKELAHPGNGQRGRFVFERICAACHALGGIGHAVGPDLAPLHDKPPADFLVAILDPNAAVEPRFINYNVETKDGRSLSGVIRNETATGFTLVQGGGSEYPLIRSEVSEIRASSLSLMPEGLEQGIAAAEMADLIAFLKSAGQP